MQNECLIRLNIDSVGYSNKPQGATVGTIRNRLCRAESIREVTPEQFITAVQRGRSWTPAAMTGTTADTWESQQIIAADVDNDTKDQEGNKVCIPNPLTPQQAVEVLGQYGINPYFNYSSFSSSDTWPRFRVVLILDQALTDRDEAKSLTSRLANVLNKARPGCTDTTIADPARLLFAGRADSVCYKSGTVTSLDTLRTLPEIRKPEPPRTIRPTPTAAMMEGNEARIRDALTYISCGQLDRAEWVNIGMALTDMQDGLAMWEEWSATDTARYKPGECARLWRGFNRGAKAFSIDHTYIVRKALENGWTPPRKQTPAPIRTETKGETMQQEHEQEQPQEITEPITTEQETAEQTPAKPSPVALMINTFKTELYKPIKTGISPIDEILGGGFFVKQLVTLGAHPGAGKTLLSQQVFETMAKAGTADILFFNLEMSSDQLFARTLSRETGYTPLEIMQGFAWTKEQEQEIEAAAAEYEATIAKRLHYNPALKGKDKSNQADSNRAHYKTILKTMEEFAKERESKELPLVVCIDYLQILQGDKGQDDVDIIKDALLEFKEFAKKHDAVVFLIMAHGRTVNSNGAPTQGSGRDTSNIEYSGDVQLSLNFTALAKHKHKTVSAYEEALATKPEEEEYTKDDITLTITKGRFTQSFKDVQMKLIGSESRFEVYSNSRQTGVKTAQVRMFKKTKTNKSMKLSDEFAGTPIS